MKYIIVDTLKAKKKLTDSGIEENHADAIVAVTHENISEICQIIFKNVATMEELENFRLRIMYGFYVAVSGAAIGILLTLLRLIIK